MVFPFYAVKVGKQPSIYTSWVRCKTQVDGFSNAVFKGFRSHEKALTWLHNHDAEVVETLAPSNSDRVFRPVTAFLGDRHLSSQAGAVCIGESSQPESVVHRSVWQVEDFLYIENVEMLLARVCASIDVGPPLFYRRETRAPDSSQLVGFAVVLPSNPLGLDVTAKGELSTLEENAREDAAFRAIERVLNATGKRILDYNYRVVMRVQKQLQELRRQ